MNFRTILFATSALGLAYTAPALAQNAVADDAENAKDIVVTGTLIRGIAPGGSQSIGVDQEKITAIGAANTSDLIGNIPQAGNFLSYTGVRGSSNFSLAVNRPSLRYLGSTSSSTASTLLLLDGHRMPGMGVLQTTPDLDAISPMAIERVEIVPDGGSATYGSDAVGGVINFITRKSFDGIEAKASYGLGDKYDQYDVAAIAGKAWDGGSAYIAYDYSWHDALKGGDRDWSRSLNWPLSYGAGADSGGITGVGFDVGSNTNCAPGNVTIGATTRPLTAVGDVGAALASPILFNRCDNAELSSIYAREGKHSVLASFVVDNGGPFSFSLKAFYVNRKTESDQGVLTANITIRSLIPDGLGGAVANPFFAPVTASGLTPANCGLAAPFAAATCATALVSLASIGLVSTSQLATLEAVGFTPSVKIDLGHDWQVNAMFNYGRGKAVVKGGATPFNSAPITAATNAGTFDPFHLGVPGNAAALNSARDLFVFGRGTNTLVNMRVVADGSLAQLPGGAIKVAIGAEYTNERYSGRNNRSITAAALAALVDQTAGRSIKSVFGEVNLPIVGADNRGFIHSLSLTASGRYDDYSDFGGTFNPKFGINFKPTEWLGFRGTWGKSFQAPGVSDIAQIGAPTLSVLDTSLPGRGFFDVLANPNPATIPAQVAAGNANHGRTILAIGGTLAPLQPQKATTWSMGLDFKPPFVSGLEMGMTYYNVDFVGLISNAPINLSIFYTLYSDKVVTWNGNGGTGGTTPNNAAMQAYWNQLAGPGNTNGVALADFNTANGLSPFNGNFDNVYAVMDGRTTNLGRVQTSGIDFYARYRHATGFGAIYVDVQGSKILTYKNGGTTGSADTWGFDANSINNTFRVNATVGADIGNLKAQGTWNHVDGFRMFPGNANLQQNKAGTFDVFNLFFQYKVPGESTIAKDLVLSLNIDNVFNTDPPIYRGISNSNNGATGWTLGRVVKIGLSKKF